MGRRASGNSRGTSVGHCKTSRKARMVNPRANDRLPPHNDEAEMCVLGSMLIDNKCIDDVLVRLGPSGADYFYASAHREIFGGIVQLFTQGRAVDFVLDR